MRKLGTLLFATLLTALALVPEPAQAYYYVCDEDCECSWACRNGSDGLCDWVENCISETGGWACLC